MRWVVLVLVLGAAVLASSQTPEPEAGPPASEYTGKHPWRRIRRNVLRRTRASAAGEWGGSLQMVLQQQLTSLYPCSLCAYHAIMKITDITPVCGNQRPLPP